MSLLDNYGVGTAAFLYGILEVVGVFWIYGLNSFCKDVQFMFGNPVSIIWKATWGVITPLVLIVSHLLSESGRWTHQYVPYLSSCRESSYMAM